MVLKYHRLGQQPPPYSKEPLLQTLHEISQIITFTAPLPAIVLDQIT